MAIEPVTAATPLVKTCEICGILYGPTAKRFHARVWAARRFCSVRCAGKGGPRIIPRPVADLFWPKVDKSPGQGPKGECWEWSASTNGPGYGIFLHRGQATGAHRVAYELSAGIEPGPFMVCHTCDNPPCCNPAHLFLGTHDDNMADMAAKGRSTHGEKHVKHKLTEEQVLAIRADDRLQREIAEDYGVAAPVVSGIKSRKYWTRI